MAAHAQRKPDFPVSGVSGGWRDRWDEPDDSAELRAHATAAERQHGQRAAVLGQQWRAKLTCEGGTD